MLKSYDLDFVSSIEGLLIFNGTANFTGVLLSLMVIMDLAVESITINRSIAMVLSLMVIMDQGVESITINRLIAMVSPTCQQAIWQY